MKTRFLRILILLVATACAMQFWTSNAYGQPPERKGLIEKVTDLEKLAEDLRKQIALNEQRKQVELDELRKQVAQLESPVAARYSCPANYRQEIPIPLDEGGIVNFGDRDYDTHKAVTTGTNKWQFEVPKGKSGIYTISAQVICSQHCGASSCGGTSVRIWRNGKPSAFLTQLSPSEISGTMLGGTTDLELNQGDKIQIRVIGFGNGGGLVVGSANATWVAIRYVRSPPPRQTES